MRRGAQARFDAFATAGGVRGIAQRSDRPPRRLLHSAESDQKMAEDKRHPGAIVASLALPWGDTATTTPRDVGYRKVWPRDPVSRGKRPACRRRCDHAADVARFMGRQQRADGSMPQNTKLEAVPV